MSTVTEIQEAIVNLTAAEREELRHWLTHYEEDDWDHQISADATSGKLDFLVKEASHAKRYGKLKTLPREVKDNP